VTQTGLDIKGKDRDHWEEIAERVEQEHRDNEERRDESEGENKNEKQKETVQEKEATSLFAGLI